MSYIITGAKSTEKPLSGNQRAKSHRASVDLIDHVNNGALAVTTYAGVQAVIVDDQSLGTVYVGESLTGSSEGDSIWRIKRITEAGGITKVEWAVAVAGDTDSTDIVGGFNHIWTNRAALTYQ